MDSLLRRAGIPASASRRSSGFLRRRDFLRVLAGGIFAFGELPRTVGASETPHYPFTAIPASASGIVWKHTAGRSPQKYLPESTGAGCAFFDYDGDGWMDVYLVNSGPCDFYSPKTPLRNALYHNNRDGTFTDVTRKAGVAGTAYGMGVAAGDYDGDGRQDLYVTQYPSSILYHNNGDGTFTDVTEKAGVKAPGWGTSAVWFDYDNDGQLDLFVCRFVDFDKEKHHACGAPNIAAIAGLNEYCYPGIFDPMPSWLFHNNGDGTFTDVSKEAGIRQNPGKAWGVVAADINNDGWMDLFVANDTVANFLFMNRRGRHFEEIGFTAGVAYSADGKARSGMGVDAADYDQDGWTDLFVTNLDHELDALYRNRHDETFLDESGPSGIAAATGMVSGWGTKFFDYDNDGNLDLFVVDGHPDDLIRWIHSGVTYREPMLLFQNHGKVFQNVSRQSGPNFSERIAGRGMALGDFDNDGAVDVLVAVNDGAPILLRNDAGRKNHWLGLHLIGQKANRDAIGARIVYQAGDLRRHRFKAGGGSYLASHDPRVVLGIGQHTKMDWLEIRWPEPSGLVQRFENPPIDRYITLTEGKPLA